ncbi:Protein I'm not dead yet [Gryllus bimaculatus]|nr:Protein I'm not dead yet [Gryllus bimaculatus]
MIQCLILSGLPPKDLNPPSATASDGGEEFRCLFVVMIMAIYWVCEVLPLGVTGLIPIAMFPILGIYPTKATCATYINDTTMMFMCSIVLAFAIESSNLHRRIALKTILIIGTTHLSDKTGDEPQVKVWIHHHSCVHNRLTFGFMTVTMFVSMWIINTAATAMMAPVVLAVLQELEGVMNPYPTRTTRCYFLGIAYSASIGGVGTLIGTGTNLTFKGIFEEKFPEGPAVDFADWVGAMLPPTLIMNTLTWVVLSWQYLGLLRKSGMDEEVRLHKLEGKERAKEAADLARSVIQEKHAELGPMSWAEIWVIVLFIIVVALWITRDPNWMTGWAPIISSVLALGNMQENILYNMQKTGGEHVAFSVLCVKSFLCGVTCSGNGEKTKSTGKRDSGLEGGGAEISMGPHVPTGRVSIATQSAAVAPAGSGFALAKGSDVSGMSHMIGGALQILQKLDPWFVLLLVCFIASNMTEFTSNVAVANILLPVISDMAVVIQINPTYLMLPAAVCCSFAFMLPVGTPPNALVAGYVNIRTTDMEFRCLFVVMVMAIYWVCEVLPLGVTGLLPIALFPILGILPTKPTCSTYLNNTTAMFLCSIFLAFAVESSNLHRRIALRTILIIGTTHLRLTFGFMAVTMFVSMWIINTAATAMMAPVALAVLQELEGEPVPHAHDALLFLRDRQRDNLRVLGIRVVNSRVVNMSKIKSSKNDEDKAGSKERAKEAAILAREVIRQKYEELGPTTWAEWWVLSWFIIAEDQLGHTGGGGVAGFVRPPGDAVAVLLPQSRPGEKTNSTGKPDSGLEGGGAEVSVGPLSTVVKINPTYLMIPATVCCSFAFMLPVGTPANAIIAGYANIRTTDMVRVKETSSLVFFFSNSVFVSWQLMITGILPTLITLTIIVAAFPTYGAFIYPDLTEFPDWAKGNDTN